MSGANASLYEEGPSCQVVQAFSSMKKTPLPTRWSRSQRRQPAGDPGTPGRVWEPVCQVHLPILRAWKDRQLVQDRGLREPKAAQSHMQEAGPMSEATPRIRYVGLGKWPSPDATASTPRLRRLGETSCLSLCWAVLDLFIDVVWLPSCALRSH